MMAERRRMDRTAASATQAAVGGRQDGYTCFPRVSWSFCVLAVTSSELGTPRPKLQIPQLPAQPRLTEAAVWAVSGHPTSPNTRPPAACQSCFVRFAHGGAARSCQTSSGLQDALVPWGNPGLKILVSEVTCIVLLPQIGTM